jgi:glycosyltransferase involved in cell wall biosynthesis
MLRIAARVKPSGDIIAIQDADLEYDPSELIKLIGVFRDRPEIDAVYGSRFLGENPRLYRRYLWGNKLLTVGTNLLYKSKYTDTYTCYKAIKRNILLNLKLESKRFEIEAEISCKLAKGKYNVVEVPINYNPRTLQDGKKIKAKDALKGILAIIKYR